MRTQGLFKLNGQTHTGLENVPTKVLRDLWELKFGGRAVTADDMHAVREDDIANVAQELVDRKLVGQQKISRMDMDKTLYYYVLEKENADC
jgi:hypothetical protein